MPDREVVEVIQREFGITQATVSTVRDLIELCQARRYAALPVRTGLREESALSGRRTSLAARSDSAAAAQHWRRSRAA